MTGTPDLESRVFLQTAVYLWQELGMLFKFPFSLLLCPSLQNQLRSRDENQFFLRAKLIIIAPLGAKFPY